MISLITPAKALKKVAENVRKKRLLLELTQLGLSGRSGIPLPTIRKFEQKGQISLESLFKILFVLGGTEDLIEALAPKQRQFKSLDEVLAGSDTTVRKRGNKT